MTMKYFTRAWLLVVLAVACEPDASDRPDLLEPPAGPRAAVPPPTVSADAGSPVPAPTPAVRADVRSAQEKPKPAPAKVVQPKIAPTPPRKEAPRTVATQAKAAPSSPRPPGTQATPEPEAAVTLEKGTDTLALMDLTIARDIQDRLPVGVATHFPEVPSKFQCYSVFKNTGEATTATHVWRRGDRVVSRVELSVGKSPRWRTWSRQRLSSAWAGRWSCEVLGPDGVRLGMASVTAGPRGAEEQGP